MIEIYTDGSSLGNPGPGGRAAVIVRDGKQTIHKGHARNVTNNQMELTAVIEGLFALKRHDDPSFSLGSITMGFGGTGSGLFEQANTQLESTLVTESITLSTDSEYVRKGVTERLPTRVKRGRRRSKGGKIIENVELRQKIHALVPYFPHLNWKRVKGHAGDHFNEIVDELARGEAEKIM